MTRAHEAFGDLRAMLNTSARPPAWWRGFEELLSGALERDLEGVRERWVPYIRGFEDVWARLVFKRLSSLEELDRWPVAFPEMRFDLELFDQRVGDAEVERIVSMGHADRMRGLNLGRCRLTSAGYEALCASPHLSELTHLTLATNAPRARGARALARMERLPSLRYLNLYDNDLDDASLEVIVRALRGEALTELNLSENRVGARTLEALRESPALGALERLRLNDTGLGDGGVALCGAEGLGALELLAMRACGMSPAGAIALIEGLELPALRWLDLEGNITPGEDAQVYEAARRRSFEVHVQRVEHTDWR